eukprot:3095549-Amphidinium_carterae.1
MGKAGNWANSFSIPLSVRGLPSPRKSKRKKFERGSDPETTEASNTAAKLARCGGWKDTSICWES